MNRRSGLIWFVVILIVSQAIFIGSFILVLQGLAGGLAWLLLTIASILEIIVIAAAAFRMIWNPLAAEFPEQELSRHASRRSFQSFSWGIVNMGLSINASTDDQYLHLEPIMIWRALGARSVSIPFTAMRVTDRGRSVKINGTLLRGPKWCFEQASTQADQKPAQETDQS